VLFFVSVGMLFDPAVLVRQPLPLLAALLIVVIGNGAVAFVVVRLFRYPFAAALLVAVGLGQIAEFSFILADLGIALGVMAPQGRALILGTSILSIFLNPLLLVLLDRVRPWLRARDRHAAPAPASAPQDDEALPQSELSDHAVLVGYGRVGRLVGDGLRGAQWPLLVIEAAPELVEELRRAGIEAILGNAAENRVLDAANLAQARLLLVAIPDAFEGGQIVAQARARSAELEIIARAHFDAEIDHLRHHGANTVIMGEREIAHAMLDHIGVPRAAAGGAGPLPAG
jgi:CPA2 family monovalent cation:H+ antiporter-2